MLLIAITDRRTIDHSSSEGRERGGGGGGRGGGWGGGRGKAGGAGGNIRGEREAAHSLYPKVGLFLSPSYESSCR